MSLNNYEEDICTCPPITDNFINRLKIDSDLIAIGKPIKIFKSENYYEQDMYLFEIDSLIKGEKSVKSILINQNESGNCSVNFSLSEKYLITGNQIEKIEKTYTMTQIKHSEKFENLIKENYTISTNSCRSFNFNSKLANLFIKNKN